MRLIPAFSEETAAVAVEGVEAGDRGGMGPVDEGRAGATVAEDGRPVSQRPTSLSKAST